MDCGLASANQRSRAGGFSRAPPPQASRCCAGSAFDGRALLPKPADDSACVCAAHATVRGRERDAWALLSRRRSSGNAKAGRQKVPLRGGRAISTPPLRADALIPFTPHGLMNVAEHYAIRATDRPWRRQQASSLCRTNIAKIPTRITTYATYRVKTAYLGAKKAFAHSFNLLGTSHFPRHRAPLHCHHQPAITACCRDIRLPHAGRANVHL